jgi:hypothetical protein
MVLYKCKFCDYSSKQKHNLLSHLNKKNKCYEYDEIFEPSLKQIEDKNAKKIEPEINEEYEELISSYNNLLTAYNSIQTENLSLKQDVKINSKPVKPDKVGDPKNQVIKNASVKPVKTEPVINYVFI